MVFDDSLQVRARKSISLGHTFGRLECVRSDALCLPGSAGKLALDGIWPPDLPCLTSVQGEQLWTSYDDDAKELTSV